MMELLNSHFENEPIIFKKISEKDFDQQYYDVKKEETIEPNKNGFIGEKLKPILIEDILNTNTTIINAGVGQGKSRTIIELISNFLSTNDYIVIIAVPFNSLIEQYFEDCSIYVNKNDIYTTLPKEENIIDDLFEFGVINDEIIIAKNSKKEAIKKLNIVTVNSLLANPGEELLFQSAKKENYFKELRNHCLETNKKIVVFFDEIHAAIKNFKPEFIYQFWHYHNLIHKSYIISATFNEASKEVIKYLSEFTGKRIRIIESKRIRKAREPSNLYLEYYSNESIKKESKLVNLLTFLIDKQAHFDMLVYSKDLINSFLKTPLNNSSGKKQVCDLLHPIKIQINRCYNDPFNKGANKKYNKSRINIGTNFTTGVNIEKENHNLIIILPKTLDVDFVNNKGVFTDGAISIIQSLARQRKKGNIYIFLEPPFKLDEESLPYNQEKNYLLTNYISNNLASDNKKIYYSDYNKQDLELKEVYKTLSAKIKPIKSLVNSLDRSGMNNLNYPSKEEFVLNKGEKYLNDRFFSGNLSTYVTWAALTNQFLNCTLKGINSGYNINFNSEYLFAEFLEYITLNIFGVLGFSGNADLGFYNKFRLEFSEASNRQILIDGKEIDKTQRNKLHLFYLSYVFRIDIDKPNEISKDEKNEIQWRYLKSCIFYSKKINPIDYNNIKHIDILKDTKYRIDSKKAHVKINTELIDCYKKWWNLLDLIKAERKTNNDRLSNKASVGFKNFINYYKKNKFSENIKQMCNLDPVFKEEILPLKTNFKTKKTFENEVDFIYNIIVKQFYGLKSKTTSKKGKGGIRYYHFSNEIEWSLMINLLY